MSIVFIFWVPLQVNGKPYNQARLLLGSMGSLHPANRLAGYITGRLRVPSCISQKVSRKIGLTEQVKDELPVKVAGKVIPPTVATQKTVDLMAVTQSPGKNALSDTDTHNLPC